MMLFTATTIDHVIPFDETYEELQLGGKLEIMLGLTSNQRINQHWMEIGRSEVDFKLYVRCLEENDENNEFSQIKIDGRVAFEKAVEARGSGIVYLKASYFKKLIDSFSKGVSLIQIPLGEIGSSYIKNEANKFEAKIELEMSQISVRLI